MAEAGHFDVVINNAGSGHFGPAENLTDEVIATQFQVLVFGQLQLMRIALPSMRQQGHGMIINVTSLAARLPVPFMAAYNAAKAALGAYLMSMQLELGSDTGIFIVDLAPADISTEFNDSVVSETSDPRYAARVAKTWKAVEHNMKAAPKPELVARAVMKLIDQDKSAAADYGWREIPGRYRSSHFPLSSAAGPDLGAKEILRDMSSVTEAVILMAGAGSRLRAGGHEHAEAFGAITGSARWSLTFLRRSSRAGIKTIHAIVGYCRDEVVAEAERFRPAGVAVRFIENPEWEKQNGISVLAARENVRSPFLLTMTDHIFDQAIVDLVVRQALPAELNLAVDRKIESDLRPGRRDQSCDRWRSHR